MEGISDLKIIGLDKERPPQILSYPCIFLFFELVHDAPEDWCDDFNRLVAKAKYTTKVNLEDRLFIETWVRKPEEIAICLDYVRQSVKTCNEAYIARKMAEKGITVDDKPSAAVSEAQMNLNRVIEGLNFDEVA
jgi:hypothetical protein